MTDEDWMQYAIKLAAKAEDEGEVPVGAVLVKDGILLSSSTGTIDANEGEYRLEVASLIGDKEAGLIRFSFPGEEQATRRFTPATLAGTSDMTADVRQG